VPATDRLGVLHGTDNQFTFTTSRYLTQPLVISGPGAGPEVTAAGVYNDLLRLDRSRDRRQSRVSAHAVNQRTQNARFGPEDEPRPAEHSPYSAHSPMS